MWRIAYEETAIQTYRRPKCTLYELKGYTVKVIGKLSMSVCFRNYNMSEMCTEQQNYNMFYPSRSQVVTTCLVHFNDKISFTSVPNYLKSTKNEAMFPRDTVFMNRIKAYLIRRYPRLCVFGYDTLFSLGGLPTHPQNPHSWRISLSLLVWPLSYGLSGLGGPTRNRKFPPALNYKPRGRRDPGHP